MPPKKKFDTFQTSCTLSLDAHAALVALAKRQDRSVSYLISKAVNEFIEREATKADAVAPPARKK